MPLPTDNLPDRVWNALKTWAVIQSQNDGFPSTERCIAQVRRIVASYTGSEYALPAAVVEFYAAETLEMIHKCRVSNRDFHAELDDTVRR